MFFNVTKPLEDDESMDIRTSTTICGIRGTCGWVESRGDSTYVGLLDGKVECIVTVDGKEETVTVNAKELLIVKKDGDHVTYEIKKLTYKDVPEFAQEEIVYEPYAMEEFYAVDVKDYIGTFGGFTISEIDSQSVNVRYSGNSTIFEGVGYASENGIYVDTLGQRIEIERGLLNGEFGIFVHVPMPIQEAWGEPVPAFFEKTNTF